MFRNSFCSDPESELTPEEKVIQKIKSHQSLTDVEQNQLIASVNSFINRLPNNQSKRMVILPDTEHHSFICAVFDDGETERFIRLYSPIPEVGNLSDDLKSKLDEYYGGDIRGDTSSAELVNFGKSHCKKPHRRDYKPEDCHCHCIFACGYALLVANEKNPLDDFNPENIREFICDTLSNGVMAEIEEPM